MGRIFAANVLAPLCLMTAVLSLTNAQACSFGRFGTSCKYKCHCEDEKCASSGSCQAGSKCVKGWFGPACQYVDLTYSNATGSVQSWLKDGDDMTCNENSSLWSVTITLTDPFPFTWLRLHVDEIGTLDISIQFDTGPCNNMKKATVDSKTLDIHCTLTTAFRQVTLSGQGVKSLCSVYISGGRNVALGESTKQSSTYYDLPKSKSSNALDGNTDGDWNKGSCTHTSETSDHTPWWEVTFSNRMAVNRYVLYNRLDVSTQSCCRQRLQFFKLSSLSPTGTELYTYNDGENTAEDIYFVISGTPASPTASVKIEATKVISGNVILTLCEVQVFGDSACEPGKYGRECDKTCNCAIETEACFVSTGGCPSGCAPGSFGESCSQTCQSGYYGTNCEACSSNCANRLCDVGTGVCTSCPPSRTGRFCESCLPTYYGPTCTTPCSSACDQHHCKPDSGFCVDCPAGKIGNVCENECQQPNYGINCALACDKCVDGRCDGKTGKCNTNCLAGWTGDACDQVCLKGTFGSDCSDTCNENCGGDGSCFPVNGTCVHACRDGYSGSMCTENKMQPSTSQSTTDSGQILGAGIGIGVGVCVLIAVIVIGLYCYRRRSEARRSRQQRPSGYEDVDMTRQSTHHYNTTYKTEDGYDLPHGESAKDATAVYENEDVGHYEYILDNGQRGEPGGENREEQDGSFKKMEDDAGYVNSP